MTQIEMDAAQMSVPPMGRGGGGGLGRFQVKSTEEIGSSVLQFKVLGVKAQPSATAAALSHYSDSLSLDKEL